MNSKKYGGPCNQAPSRSDVLIDKALITVFQVLPKFFLMVIALLIIQYRVEKMELRRMNDGRIGGHPISREAVYFARE
jgi:hypothetical protein